MNRAEPALPWSPAAGTVYSSQPGVPPPLEALLSRTATGDVAAFAELFDHLAPRVLAWLTARVERDAAEELMQEVMVRIWRHAAGYEPAQGCASTWVFRMARGALVDAGHARREPVESSDPTYVPDPRHSADDLEYHVG